MLKSRMGSEDEEVDEGAAEPCFLGLSWEFSSSLLSLEVDLARAGLGLSEATSARASRLFSFWISPLTPFSSTMRSLARSPEASAGESGSTARMNWPGLNMSLCSAEPEPELTLLRMALLGLARRWRGGLRPIFATSPLCLSDCRVHHQQAHGAERSADSAYHVPVEAVAVGTLLQAAEKGQGCPSLCVRAHLALRQLSGTMRGLSGGWRWDGLRTRRGEGAQQGIPEPQDRQMAQVSQQQQPSTAWVQN
ncbi:hypothetical protein MC885_007265 [Smutsia gigantea]|nr:hypothetical protein MC885_007265 [Smutsia gigantea]